MYETQSINIRFVYIDIVLRIILFYNKEILFSNFDLKIVMIKNVQQKLVNILME